MTTTISETDSATVIKMRTELTASDCEQFRTQVIARMDDRVRDCVLDMSALEIIDSEGLETLLWLQDVCAEKLGQVRLVACNPHVVKILELTRLAPQFERHRNVEEAIRSLQ